jgi:hypothetical protein
LGVGSFALAIIVAVLQDLPCRGEGVRHVTAAVQRGEWFDLAGAADAYQKAAAAGCAEADVAAQYLSGLDAAREAYRQGGSPESLAAVIQAMAVLEARAGGGPRPAQIARVVLQAAAAAAQSERDEMSLLLDYAVRLEAVQLEARQPGLPVVTAHEVAGDLWFQVHGYEEARRAYLLAAERIGPTPRLTLGLARAAARLKDTVTACTHYRELAARWGGRNNEPSEVAEARAYFTQPLCGPVGPDSRLGQG